MGCAIGVERLDPCEGPCVTISGIRESNVGDGLRGRCGVRDFCRAPLYKLNL